METMMLSVASGVATVVFNRPERLNSISEPFLDDLEAVLEEVEGDTSVNVLVVRGEGRAFCVGLDVDLLQRCYSDAGYYRSILARYAHLLLRLERAPVPVLAGVNGLARAGGFELILACDLVVIADEARIGDNHANFGVMPGGGSTQRLPRKIGDQRAKDLIMTARWLSGTEAVEYGLALRSVPLDSLDAAVEQLVDLLQDKPRACFAAIKRAMRRGALLPIEDAVFVELEEFDAYVLSSPEVMRKLWTSFEGRKTGPVE